jgi:hypothetical protein
MMLSDDHKPALCTDPNSRPPLFDLARKYELNQPDAGTARLVHNHPAGEPAPSRAEFEGDKVNVDCPRD